MSLGLLFLLAAPHVISDDKDIFSSTADLSRLLRIENSFVEQLQQMAERMERDLEIIKTFLDTNYKDYNAIKRRFKL